MSGKNICIYEPELLKVRQKLEIFLNFINEKSVQQQYSQESKRENVRKERGKEVEKKEGRSEAGRHPA